MSDQFVVFDTEGTTLYEIHQGEGILAGFDYLNQSSLSREECSKLIRKLNDSQECVRSVRCH